jgi:hypothetical protein
VVPADVRPRVDTEASTSINVLRLESGSRERRVGGNEGLEGGEQGGRIGIVGEAAKSV